MEIEFTGTSVLNSRQNVQEHLLFKADRKYRNVSHSKCTEIAGTTRGPLSYNANMVKICVEYMHALLS